MTEHLNHLAELEAAVEQAKQRETRAEAELRASTAALGALHAERLRHEREVGAGAERDPSLEQRFAVLLDPDVVEVSNDFGLHWLDRRCEARVQGAREAREAREAELHHFAGVHLDPLEEELGKGLEDERRQVREIADALADALRAPLERELRASRLRSWAGATGGRDFVGEWEVLDELRRVLGRLERAA